MNPLRALLIKQLGDLGVEVRAWPKRDDGFASLIFNGKDFAHFHDWTEIDIRLGKDVIKREGLVHPPESRVHPDRAKGSPWYEMQIRSSPDVNEAIRLVKIAIQGLKGKK